MNIITRLLVLTLYVLVVGQLVSPNRLVTRRGDAFQVYARQFARQYEPYMFAAIPLHAPVPVLRVLTRAPLQPRARAPDAHAAPSSHHAVLAPRGYLPEPHYADHTRVYPHPHLQLQDTEPQDTRHYPQSTRNYPKPARPYAPEQEYEASTYEYPRPTYYHKPPRQVAYEYGAAAAREYGPYAAPLQVPAAALPQLTYAYAPYEEAYATQEAAPAVLYARPSPGGGFTYRRVPDATAPPKKKASALKEKEKDLPFIVKIHKYRIVRDDLI